MTVFLAGLAIGILIGIVIERFLLEPLAATLIDDERG